MSEFTGPSGSFPGNDPGVLNAFLRLVGSVVRHLQALSQLALTESKEAGSVYVKLLVYLIIALTVAIFGYAFLVLTIAFLLEYLFGWRWLWVALFLSIAHFGLAALCLWRARECYRTPVFPLTSAEIKRDSAILQNAGQPPVQP